MKLDMCNSYYRLTYEVVYSYCVQKINLDRSTIKL